MKFLLAIALALAVQLCAGAWTDPFKLPHRNSESTFPQMYTDPVSKVTHLIWIDNQGLNFNLVYSRKFPNKEPSTPVTLESRYRARLSQIIGEGDGKHILITYDAKRTQGDSYDCTDKEIRGCYEIFFIESFNGGDTWSQPKQILHADPKDANDRKGPRITYVKESKLTVITYWCNGPMAYSTRQGSGDFAAETLFDFGNNLAYQSVFHTINPNTKSPVLHFTYTRWTYPTEWLMYTSSKDGGKTWETPKQIATNIHKTTYDSYIRSYSIANSDIMPGALFTTFVQSNYIKLMWSTDEGKTWSSALSTHPGDAVAPRIQLCRQPGSQKPKVHLFFGLRAPQAGNSFVFGTLELERFTYHDNELPFKGKQFNWDYMLDCYVDGDKTMVGTVIESFDDDEELNVIYLSYNNELK